MEIIPKFLLSIFNSKNPLKFFLKAILYLASYLILHLSICDYILNKRDYAWGEFQDFQNRLQYLRKNSSKYNAVFVGSSIMKHHVNPYIFDSIVTKKHSIKSFNLGSNGMFVPTSFSIAEKIIKDTSLNLKYVFLDYDFMNDIGRYLHTQKAYYWIDMNYLKFTISSTIHSELPLTSKFKIIYQYTESYFEKNMAFGAKLNLYNYQIYFGDMDKFELEHNGYMSLNYELDNLGKNNDGRLRTAHINFLNDTTLLEQSFLKAKIISSENKNINEPFVSKMITLIDIAKRRHIKLIFLFQPSNSEKYIYCELNQISKLNKIDVSLNPDFYKAGYHFDNTHLNDSGAIYFSTILARQFLLINQ